MAGFPDSFIAHENEITAQRQFGNAVVPTAVEHVLGTVIVALRDADARQTSQESRPGCRNSGIEQSRL